MARCLARPPPRPTPERTAVLIARPSCPPRALSAVVDAAPLVTLVPAAAQPCHVAAAVLVTSAATHGAVLRPRSAAAHGAAQPSATRRRPPAAFRCSPRLLTPKRFRSFVVSEPQRFWILCCPDPSHTLPAPAQPKPRAECRACARRDPSRASPAGSVRPTAYS
eukprot:7376968-Prymnesium_polylepis.1